jgi:hypothetical protein
MRLLVFGTRTFSNRESLYQILDDFDRGQRVSLVIEGEAPGADTLARDWANSRGIEVAKFPAAWDIHGRAAGPIRNRQMVMQGKPDTAIGFVDKPIVYTKGSKNMYNQLIKAGIPVSIHEVE